MKRILIITFAAVLQGCAATSVQTMPAQTSSATSVESSQDMVNSSCIGSTELTGNATDRFDPIIDEVLLAQALGEPNKGGLCQGQVYQSNSEITLYRAWNSTNPNSKLGSWWALEKPAGLVAQYREDYEICYQWSPLDKLVQCTLKAGSKVVIGNGQSAMCSEYLTYGTSPAQQVFIADASELVGDCQEYDAVFSWQ